MQQSVGKLLAASAARLGDAEALVCDGRTWTFRELDEASSRLASGLSGLGIGQGDVVSLYAPNSAEWIIGYYGVFKLGGVVNPLNLMLTPGEVAFAVQDCGAVAILGNRDKIASLHGVDLGESLRHRLAWGGETPVGALDFDAVIAGASADWNIPDIDPLAVSTIGYTSGTTGHPKGAQLTHQTILLNTAMTATYHLRTKEDVIVSALPCSHVYGNIVMNAAIAYGSKLVLHALFDVERALSSIAEYRATLFEGVPTMYMYMLASPLLGQYDLSSLTRCTVGGQTMPLAKMQAVEAALGCRMLELWGMTELGGLGTTHSVYGPAKLGSIGVVLPFMEARIASAEEPSETLPDGEVGELQMRGPLVMKGYLNRPEATAETILPDGWLRTGDLGYKDADGHFFIVDRLKDMIITGGFNIYPAELERVIAEHGDVAMVAVCGLKDDAKGEVAAAFVVAKPGTGLCADALNQHCRARLAAYKVPRAFHFVDDLPRTSSGKIMRRKLSELLPKPAEAAN
ncbi:long-chain fatty acid--CoA ligase [soil metagenome]